MKTRKRNDSEILPPIIEVDFKIDPGSGKAITLVNNIQLGDELSDNAYQPDYYRFHDVFHFSYSTFLDWSPCIRHLLKCKRKSDSEVDNVEDGARARSLEEGISAIIFEEARRNNYFESQDVSIETLKYVMGIVSRLEVKEKSTEDWMLAVRNGYRAFRHLVQNNGGKIRFDRLNKTIFYGTVHS